MKKIVFASALALTLAGAVLTNDVFANDRLVATQSADGRNENVLSSEVLNPSSGNVLVGLKGEFLTQSARRWRPIGLRRLVSPEPSDDRLPMRVH